MKFFLIFRESLLAPNQIDNLFYLVFSMSTKQSASLWDKKALVLSANKIKCTIVDALFISLIQSKKNNGPKIEPCGTPHEMLVHEEL